MQLRLDRYEVRRMDKYNWAVYEVMPDGYETKSPLPKADDGRYLRHTGTYHGTPAAAIRRACKLLEDEAVECPDAEAMAGRLEAFERFVSDLADRIGADVKRLEAARAEEARA